MVNNEDNINDSRNIDPAFISDEADIDDYLTEEQILFELPIYWIENKRSINILEDRIIELTGEEKYSAVVNDIVRRVISEHQAAKQQYIQMNFDIDDWLNDNAYSEEEWDRIILYFLHEEWSYHMKEVAYQQREPNFFWDIREADGEYVFRNRGCGSIVLAMFLTVVLFL